MQPHEGFVNLWIYLLTNHHQILLINSATLDSKTQTAGFEPAHAEHTRLVGEPRNHLGTSAVSNNYNLPPLSVLSAEKQSNPSVFPWLLRSYPSGHGAGLEIQWALPAQVRTLPIATFPSECGGWLATVFASRFSSVGRASD